MIGRKVKYIGPTESFVFPVLYVFPGEICQVITETDAEYDKNGLKFTVGRIRDYVCGRNRNLFAWHRWFLNRACEFWDG